MDCKRIFAEALKKLSQGQSLDKITVKEIVKQSGLGRTTFYNHFVDKYDLANWMHNEIQREVIFEKMYKGCSYYECVLSSLQGYTSYPEFYYGALKPKQSYSLRKYIVQLSFDFVKEFLIRKGMEFDDAADLILMIFCTGGVALTADWASGRVSMSAEECANIQTRAIPYEFKKWIDLP